VKSKNRIRNAGATEPKIVSAFSLLLGYLVLLNVPSTGLIDGIANCFLDSETWSRPVTNNSVGQQLGPVEGT